MNRKTLTDKHGDSLEFRAHGNGDIYVEASEDDETACSGPFTPEQLRAALDEVAPAGSYTRTDEQPRPLTAALTEPTRPEGAEDWEDWLIHTLDHGLLTYQQIEDLANRVAQRVTEEQP